MARAMGWGESGSRRVCKWREGTSASQCMSYYQWLQGRASAGYPSLRRATYLSTLRVIDLQVMKKREADRNTYLDSSRPMVAERCTTRSDGPLHLRKRRRVSSGSWTK